MRWISTTTQKDYDVSYRLTEQLRHERLELEASIIDWIETTPSHEPLPRLTMARLREAHLQQAAQQLRDIWTDDKEEQLII